MANISPQLGFLFSEAQEYAQNVCDEKKIYANGDFPESVQKGSVRFGYSGTTLELFRRMATEKNHCNSLSPSCFSEVCGKLVVCSRARNRS